MPVASNGVRTAPSKSEPSATWSTPATSIGVADRAGDGRRIVAAAGGRPEADADEPAGRGHRRGSDRRSGCGLLSATPRTPVCDATTGRVARPGRRRWSRGTRGRGRRASSRLHPPDHLATRRSARPSSMPWAEPPNALSKKWHGDIIRKPASTRTSMLSGSSSSACAPSIARRAAVDRPARRAGARYASRSAAVRMIVEAARRTARPCRRPAAMCSARSGRLRQVAGGQPRRGQEQDVVAAVVVALDVQVARRLGRRGQDLEGDVAVDEARDVDVAALAALEQVAAPQERVGVEVGHGQRLVEFAGSLRCRVRAARSSGSGDARSGRRAAGSDRRRLPAPRPPGRPRSRPAMPRKAALERVIRPASASADPDDDRVLAVDVLGVQPYSRACAVLGQVGRVLRGQAGRRGRSGPRPPSSRRRRRPAFVLRLNATRGFGPRCSRCAARVVAE